MIDVVSQWIHRKSCLLEVHRSTFFLAFLMSRNFKRSGGMVRCNGFRQDMADGVIIGIGGASWFNRAIFLLGVIVDCREIAWEHDSKATHMTYDSEAQWHWQSHLHPMSTELQCYLGKMIALTPPQCLDHQINFFFQNHLPDLLSWSSYAIHMFWRSVFLKSAQCNIKGVVEMSIERSAACDFFSHPQQLPMTILCSIQLQT